MNKYSETEEVNYAIRVFLAQYEHEYNALLRLIENSNVMRTSRPNNQFHMLIFKYFVCYTEASLSYV